jgi:molybdenum cofactor cytidylyltransferase
VIAALLLAAGESTRMGQPKALLPWGGLPLLDYQLRELAASAAGEPIVVLGHRAEELAPIVRRYGARAVINPRYREGRATSIAAGMAAVPPDAEAVLVASVDQPRPRSVFDGLIAAHRRLGGPITRAVHGQRHGHPTVFARTLFEELRRVSEESEGLKSVLRRHADQIHDADLGDPIVLVNLNTPAEYRAALAALHRPPTGGRGDGETG